MTLTDYIETPTMDDIEGKRHEAEAQGNVSQREWHGRTGRLQIGEDVTFFVAAIHVVGFLAELCMHYGSKPSH